MAKQARPRKTETIAQPRYTGYGIMVFAIALLGITVLLLNVSEAKQTIQQQNLITAKVVQTYKQDVGALQDQIATLETKLAACHAGPSP